MRTVLRVVLVAVMLIASGCTAGKSLPSRHGFLAESGASRTTSSITGSFALVFTAFDSTIKSILETAVQPGDYISTAIASNDATILNRVGQSHVVKLIDDNTAIAATLTSTCPADGVVLYDIEHWSNTPVAQQSDPAGSIISSQSTIRAQTPCAGSGFTNYVAGITPDGEFDGWQNGVCAYDPSYNGAFYNETATGSPISGTTWVNTGTNNSWTTIGIYNIQAHRLLNTNPTNACYGSQALWWSAVNGQIVKAQAGNASIVSWAEVSLRESDPNTIINAIDYSQSQKAGGQAGPSAYYIAYPTAGSTPQCPDPSILPTPAPHSNAGCTYVEAENLQALLYGLGRPTPAPSATPTPTPTSTPTPTPAPTPTQNCTVTGLATFGNAQSIPACVVFYSANSPWHYVLPASPTRLGNSDKIVNIIFNNGYGGTMGTNSPVVPAPSLPYAAKLDYDTPYYIGTDSDPGVIIHCTAYPGGYPSCGSAGGTQPEGHTMHIPANAYPEQSGACGADGHIIVLDLSSAYTANGGGGKEFYFYQDCNTRPLTNGQTFTVGNGSWADPTNGNGFNSSDVQGGPPVASGAMGIGGAVKLSELQAGLYGIKHAIQTGIACGGGSKVYPVRYSANMTCQGSDTTDVAPMGTFFWWDEDCPHIAMRNIDNLGKAVLCAMHTYGAVMTDTTGGPTGQGSFELQVVPEDNVRYKSLGNTDISGAWLTTAGNATLGSQGYTSNIDTITKSDIYAHLHALDSCVIARTC